MPKNKEVVLKKMPIIPVRGLTIFPYMSIHFDIGREKSVLGVEESLQLEQDIFVSVQLDNENDEPKNLDDFNQVGTVCKIKQVLRLPNNILRVLLEGISRGVIREFYDDTPFFEGNIEIVEDPNNKATIDQKAMMRSIASLFEDYISVGTRSVPEIISMLNDIDEPGKFCDIICTNMILNSKQRQDMIEEFDVDKRLEKLHEILSKENKIVKLEQKIQQRVRREMTKSEKIYYLREQLKAINKELGQYTEQNQSETQKYKEELEKLDVPEKVKEKISKEIAKLERESRMGPEAEVSRTYIETFFSLPWNKETKEKINLSNSKKILDKDHFGMEKVKDRILEYLAVRKMSKKLKSPILCFVGPPGVGKTSIAKSIAKSVNREFVRISLGGVRDEAEIRGHRRTYIGAIPGRIIDAIINVKTNNPVILFDEIDKMSSDFKGNVASAMLEVLDPEQNKTFTDHYLEYEFDLSKVFFITTANSLDTIPRPLRDRMEIIELSGYTEMEKLQIAKKYLIPKQVSEHNFENKFIKISDEVLKKIISEFTRESGVRKLEQRIAQICRKIARKKVEEPKLKSVTVKIDELEDYLGKPVFRYEKINEKPQIGIVRGLAWTQVGGDTLSIELNVMNGAGKVELTGKLGEVMKESAKTALSYVRSISQNYNIDENFYKTKDIHIHIPEGAIPKDGPSAGITMGTAILSALADIRVREDIAMTGEITLRGRVLPVGGIKEKLLAAHRAGIYNIILPKENEKDLQDLPQEIRNAMNFTLAEDMKQVLEVALVKEDIKKIAKNKTKAKVSK